jgi:transposase
VRRDRDTGCCHAVSEHNGTGPGGNGPVGGPGAGLTELVSHLYLCQGLSTYRISEIVGISRQRVGRLLNRSGVPVKPRGAGRRRPPDAEQAALTDLMERLYQQLGLSSGLISALTGIPERTVRDRLQARGVRIRTRGRWNRQDRLTVPADTLADLYLRAGLSAAEAGKRLGVSGRVVLRAAHDQGLPVRIGGPAPRRGPVEIELVDALYADPAVRQVLARHHITSRPAGGPIWRRFPVPLTVGPELAQELYVSCGLSLRHIELLTGQPAETIRDLLHAHGVSLRRAGGRSPFMRRWRGAG